MWWVTLVLLGERVHKIHRRNRYQTLLTLCIVKQQYKWYREVHTYLFKLNESITQRFTRLPVSNYFTAENSAKTCCSESCRMATKVWKALLSGKLLGHHAALKGSGISSVHVDHPNTSNHGEGNEGPAPIQHKLWMLEFSHKCFEHQKMQ